jgi:hypothetical protein
MDGSTSILIDAPAIGEAVKPLEMVRAFLACASGMVTIAGGGDPDDMREKLGGVTEVAAHSLLTILTEIDAPDIETAELIGALQGWLS